MNFNCGVWAFKKAPLHGSKRAFDSFFSFYIPTYIQLVKPKEAAMAVRSERAILITVFQVSRFIGYIF